MRRTRVLFTAALLLTIAGTALGWRVQSQRPARIADRMLDALRAELASGKVTAAMDSLHATIVGGTAVSDSCTATPARCTYKASMAYRMPEHGREPATFVLLEASTEVDTSEGAPPVPGPWRWQVIVAGVGENRSVNFSTGPYVNLERTPAARGTNASLVLLKAMETGIEKALARQG